MKDDKALRKVLQQKITQIKEYPRSAQKEVENTMNKRYNVKFGDTVDMFNGISPFSIGELSYEMLFKLMNSIHEVAKDRWETFDASDLFADTYFTETEKIEFESPYSTEENDFDIVITDWKQRSPYKITVYTDINEVVYRWRNFNKLRFNPETQRDLITIVRNGVKLKKLDINRTSINDMKRLMIKELYFPVRGIININPDYFETPRIEGKILIIPMESHMDLIEGFHNYIAMCEVKDENPDWEYLCEFDIMLLNTDEANRFILQMDKKNHFKAAQTVRLDKLNQVNYVIDQLNKNSDFHLYGTINDKIKVFLNNVISHLFIIDDNRELAISVYKLLEKGLNTIIEKYNHFNKPLTKDEWFIYINLVKYSNNNDIPIAEIIDLIDINLFIEELNIVNVPLNKHYKLINKLISEVSKNVL